MLGDCEIPRKVSKGRRREQETCTVLSLRAQGAEEQEAHRQDAEGPERAAAVAGLRVGRRSRGVLRALGPSVGVLLAASVSSSLRCMWICV